MEETFSSHLKLHTKTIWGRSVIYPNCPLSGLLAGFKRAKSLNLRDLKTLKELGVEMEYSGREEDAVSLYAEYMGFNDEG